MDHYPPIKPHSPMPAAVQQLVHAFHCHLVRCTNPFCEQFMDKLVRMEYHARACNRPQGCKVCRLWDVLHIRARNVRDGCRKPLKPLWRKALQEQRVRHRLLMRRWRCIAKSIGPLLAALRHASEVAYVPGGIGFKHCREEFEGLMNVGKRAKPSESQANTRSD